MVTIASLESNISLGLGFLSSLGPKVDVVGIFSNGAGQGGAPSSSGISGLSPTILNSILGISNVTASIGQLFVNARPMKATIRETSKVMEHPVETGVTLSDHHIINPVEIDIPLVVTSTSPGLIGSLTGSVALNYASTYSQIRQNFLNATPLSVKTNVGVFSNMIIADMPHEEDPDRFDVITINLHLKQVIYALPNGGGLASNYQPLAPANSNSLAAGLQQATTIAGQVASTAAGIASFANVLRL